MSWIPLILALIFSCVISFFYKRRKHRSLPDISDREFLLRFSHSLDTSPDFLLSERNRVANTLGISPKKLDPDHGFDDLVRMFEPSIEIRVGWGDLIDDANFLASEKGKRMPQGGLRTIKDYILFMAAGQ